MSIARIGIGFYCSSARFRWRANCWFTRIKPE